MYPCIAYIFQIWSAPAGYEELTRLSSSLLNVLAMFLATSSPISFS